MPSTKFCLGGKLSLKPGMGYHLNIYFSFQVFTKQLLSVFVKSVDKTAKSNYNPLKISKEKILRVLLISIAPGVLKTECSWISELHVIRALRYLTPILRNTDSWIVRFFLSEARWRRTAVECIVNNHARFKLGPRHKFRVVGDMPVLWRNCRGC